MSELSSTLPQQKDSDDDALGNVLERILCEFREIDVMDMTLQARRGRWIASIEELIARQLHSPMLSSRNASPRFHQEAEFQAACPAISDRTSKDKDDEKSCPRALGFEAAAVADKLRPPNGIGMQNVVERMPPSRGMAGPPPQVSNIGLTMRNPTKPTTWPSWDTDDFNLAPHHEVHLRVSGIGDRSEASSELSTARSLSSSRRVRQDGAESSLTFHGKDESHAHGLSVDYGKSLEERSGRSASFAPKLVKVRSVGESDSLQQCIELTEDSSDMTEPLNEEELKLQQEHIQRKKSWSGIEKIEAKVDTEVVVQPEEEDLGQLLYDVTNFYHERGFSQWLARNESFANVTLAVISLNALYIGVDEDVQPPEELLKKNAFFQVCEVFFFSFFTFEWCVRLCAFRRKRDCLRDSWFKFDTCLVGMMYFDIMATNVWGSSSCCKNDASGLVKLLRLLRLARVARLMRAFPELVAMIKGVKEASRAVGSALMMVLLLIYIFAIIMHMSMQEFIGDDPLLAERFTTLGQTMWTLFMDGTLLDGVSITTRLMLARGAWVAFSVLLLFVLMSAMTVMNMLIGVLCEVVTAVAASEKEDAAIRMVKETVLVMLQNLDEDGSGEISKSEMNMVFDDEAALQVLSNLQVDLTHLVDYLDMYFEQQSDLSIPQILDLILMLRGDRPLTMKDMLDGQAFGRWKYTNTLALHEERLMAKSQSIIKLLNEPEGKSA
eukprot:TRINITY_DN10635_c0_g7_i1.p1 TRINITY_DN10635_c0_g7~~TRINITY_DN10635_c0_g7_i1.p1  ORF type:complete len:721 (-),score=155.81 TRINITY_DN10635_c0_g7_i1:205-2367(-)